MTRGGDEKKVKEDGDDEEMYDNANKIAMTSGANIANVDVLNEQMFRQKSEEDEVMYDDSNNIEMTRGADIENVETPEMDLYGQQSKDGEEMDQDGQIRRIDSTSIGDI